MKDFFQFKQFSVNQAGCGMKINTDGVLLGALVKSESPATVLDIGTGTGVIALMLAQRFPGACIDAIEIDAIASETAMQNFLSSRFSDHLKVYPNSFQNFSREHPGKKYDLIVSNPPFFTNSLKNPDNQKHLARHTSEVLFNELVEFAKNHLTKSGTCYFILPLEASRYFIEKSLKYELKLQTVINISSSGSKSAHRQIIGLGMESQESVESSFIIYQSEKKYSQEFETALKDFFTIF
ncbi:methyltransferase [Pedobacter sp. P351]|uniref:tRNA1(Val) (adenine(37)-N6)-methyltransferase n=1 Tax=Pedobacter superstes TaxID=3133441 RepID=UPI0030AB28F9